MIMLTNNERDLRNAADRSLKETRRDFDKRIDDIRAQLQERGPEAAEKVERSLNDLKEELRDGFGAVNGKFEDELETDRDQVREHPLLAVGVAVMAGVIFGMLLGNNKD